MMNLQKDFTKIDKFLQEHLKIWNYILSLL